MNFDNIKNFLIYVLSFSFAMYALQSVNYEKFIRSGKVTQAQFLYILLAMALGYLVAQFLLAIIF
ncbi:MAG: DUF1146 family protein [Erysipelotrichaceae bacterium]|nr:DUF1146 family protein [Erysipelotrichaceae bacterium]MDY5252392.1 DUF1146 family protein [Erysipelotrichaceae bacterium]